MAIVRMYIPYDVGPVPDDAGFSASAQGFIDFSALQFSLNYAGTSSAEITAPNLLAIERVVDANTLRIRFGGSTVVTVDVTNVSTNVTPRGQSLTVSGSRAIPWAKGGATILAQSIASESSSNGIRSCTCRYDYRVKPGRSIVTTAGTFIIGSVSHTALQDGMMSVEELSAADEAARLGAEQNSLYPGTFRGVPG